jgi:hypothetical protein
VPTKLELLESTLERGFPLGEDIPPVLADPERTERLRGAVDEIAAKDLVVESGPPASILRASRRS